LKKTEIDPLKSFNKPIEQNNDQLNNSDWIPSDPEAEHRPETSAVADWPWASQTGQLKLDNII